MKKEPELIDIYAMFAMNGLLSGLLANGMDIEWRQIARDSFKQANAMLEERENWTGGDDE